MKFKWLLFFCLTGVMAFGCGSTTQILKTPTKARTPFPSNTPYPTYTPVPPLKIEACAVAEDCPDSTWIGDFVGGDLQTGILYDVDIPFDSTIRVHARWCTLNNANLQDNMEHISFFFEIDGRSYLDQAGMGTSFMQDSEDASVSYPCTSIGVTLAGWKIGEGHQVAIGFEIEEQIFDGWDTYAPQTFQYLFDIHPAAIPTNTPTATPNPVAVVNTESAIRSGPGTNYAWLATASVNMELILLGRVSDCSWLVVSMPDGKQGWIKADYITYDMPCEMLELAAIPPTPTLKPAVPPTPTSCAGETVSISIKNDTGGAVTLHLSGPCSYRFSLQTGSSTINVLPGNYSYTAYGCGGASISGNKTLNAGDEWTWYCE